ncbi:MAG TPA: hypothetical protein VGF59_05545, partial [Bryobacteraceae bacterium]
MLRVRELFKSAASLSWAMALFGWSRIGRLLASPQSGTAAKETAAIDRVVQTALAAMGSGPGASRPDGAGPLSGPGNTRRVNSGRLDVSRMAVLGEGLAAGMGNFSLSSISQKSSFPALIAAQTGAGFSQRLIQPPGIVDAPGFPRLPVRIPGAMQTTVVEDFPAVGDPTDLSFPGCRLTDVLNLRPSPPIVWHDDARQTAANLILGMREFVTGGSPMDFTPLDRAVSCRPTFTILCLGFYEALDAATLHDASHLPDAHEFGASMARLIGALRAVGSEVLALSVPDPLDTAHFSSLDTAVRIVKVQRSLLQRTYGLDDGDRITLNGLVEVGNQFLAQSAEPLCPTMKLAGPVARAVSERVADWNRQICRAATEQGAIFYDLAALFRCVKHNGAPAANRMLSGDYLGGFYALNGYYPGAAGHAVIANEILKQLNAAYGAGFPPVDISTIAANDPVTQYQAAGGPDWTWSDVPRGWPIGPVADQLPEAAVAPSGSG